MNYVLYREISSPQHQAIALIDETKTSASDKIVLLLSYSNLSYSELLIRASVDFCLAYESKKADGILIYNGPKSDNSQLKELALEILQGCGLRYSKTEFVACPSCGRSSINIEKELGKVKRRLGSHKGLKIAVMGCRVNGPGEMVGADYGFVGSASGKVNLYKGSEILFRNLPEEEALDKLEKIILK